MRFTSLFLIRLPRLPEASFSLLDAQSLTLTQVVQLNGSTAYYLVLASNIAIDWTNLAEFFGLFYTTLFAGREVTHSLDTAVTKFPEFKSFNMFSNY